jgi:signal transduction histidine kinase
VSRTAKRNPDQESIGEATRVASGARRGQGKRSRLAGLAALLVATEPLLSTLDEFAAAPLAESALAGRLAELARTALGAEQSGLIAVDPETGTLVPMAVAGVPAAIETLWRASLARARLSDYLDAAHVAGLRAGQALAFRWEQTPLNRCLFFGMPAATVAPLRVGVQLIGLLGLNLTGSRQRHTVADVALAQAVAAFAALAIDRVRLLREQVAARSSAEVLRDGHRFMEHALDHTAHEIKNPVTAISSNIQWVERRLDRLLGQPALDGGDLAGSLAEVRVRLRSIKDKTQLLKRLALDLEDGARTAADRLALRQAPCDLFDIVRRAVEDQRQVAPTRALALTPSREVQIPIVADEIRIGQVLTNYLSNAIKYSPVDGPISVTIHVEGDWVRVAVRDRGPGLPPEEHARVWERLYRSATVQRQTGSEDGLGLGLYISRAIVEQHGGEVGIESSAGQGCAFWFTLPLARSDT